MMIHLKTPYGQERSTAPHSAAHHNTEQHSREQHGMLQTANCRSVQLTEESEYTNQAPEWNLAGNIFRGTRRTGEAQA